MENIESCKLAETSKLEAERVFLIKFIISFGNISNTLGNADTAASLIFCLLAGRH